MKWLLSAGDPSLCVAPIFIMVYIHRKQMRKMSAVVILSKRRLKESVQSSRQRRQQQQQRHKPTTTITDNSLSVALAFSSYSTAVHTWLSSELSLPSHARPSTKGSMSSVTGYLNACFTFTRSSVSKSNSNLWVIDESRITPGYITQYLILFEREKTTCII